MGTVGSVALAAAFISGALSLGFMKTEKRALAQKTGMLSGALVIAASLVLLYLLIAGDFSVDYVYRNTARDLPLIYKISAFWSGSAGSLLLWAACDSAVYLLLCILLHARKKQNYLSYLTAVITILNLGFLTVLLFINSPFKPADISGGGFGLNPSLQSIGMVFHPPLIMLSYACVFVSLAVQLAESLHPEGIMKPTAQRAALISWILLTAGIISGGLWAYRELGWGGFWGWDPIENAALVTWLLLTAYLHIAAPKTGGKNNARALTILITASAFSCLFGTFLARSGILSSVHSYSSQAVRTFFPILLLLLSAILLLLGIFVIKKGKRTGGHRFDIKRAVRYIPSILLTAGAAAVALLTVWPLLPLNGGEISKKTFDIVFGIVGLLLLICSSVRYAMKYTAGKQRLTVVFISVICGAAVLFLPAFAVYSIFTRLALAAAVLCMAGLFLSLIFGLNLVLTHSRNFTVFILHLAVVIIALGLIGTREMKVETTAVLHKGDTAAIGAYVLTLQSTSVDDSPLIKTWTAGISVDSGKKVRLIDATFQYYRQKDIYHAKSTIISSIKEDLCVIVENAADDGTVLLKVSLLKWVSLLWVGIILLVLSSVFLCWTNFYKEGSVRCSQRA
jgi:cytochrome c-type biogenesis protein CcmF